VPSPNFELGVDFISDLLDIPSALVMGISSVLTFVMNTTLPAVHRESFALLK